MEAKVKLESKTGRLMKEVEELSEQIKLMEETKKYKAQSLLDICNEKDIDKLLLDDGERQLLSTIRITKDSRKWDDERIKLLIPNKYKKTVIKTETKIVQSIDYDALTLLFENGEILEEDYLSMFSTSKTQYTQTKRATR